ncbi:MAG: PIN domain-containing protein [Dehalococcoidia bacterium]
MIVADATPIIAASERRAPNRALAQAWLQGARERIVVSAPVTAEVDYMLATRGSLGSARNFISDVAAGRFQVECLANEEYALILSLMDQYQALEPGLADLSVVILAYRFNTTRILTFDQKHFRAMKPLQGGSFTLLPFDEPAPDPRQA